jgi:hypothetical protein
MSCGKEAFSDKQDGDDAQMRIRHEELMNYYLKTGTEVSTQLGLHLDK